MSAGAAAVERWTPESRIAIAAAAIIVAVLAIGPAIFSANAVDKLTTLFIYVILALMWNALVGFCGLVSIGQQAFFGLGAYAAIRLAGFGVSVYPSLFLGALIVGALSWPLSLLMLRLKGGEFAIGMWVVSELAHLIVNLDTLVRGETGTSLIELNAYASESRRALTYWCALAAMTGLLAIVFSLLRSPLGAAIQAIRDNEEAAESIGVRVMSAKRLVFTLAAFGAALAGALWVATALTFQPKAYFSPLWTAYMIFMALVGGLGTFEGAILGAVVFFAIETWFGDMGVWYLVGLGATALIFALLFPRGLWGWVEDRTSLRLLPIGYRLRAANLGRERGGRLRCSWERRSSSPESRPASARASANSLGRSAPTSSASTSIRPRARSTRSSRPISARPKAWPRSSRACPSGSMRSATSPASPA
jgi:branched-chain amino acid transport system permease protein